ncbi:MAG: hypothetical protein HZA78_04050 [Candidatus Schekmanbacteria bacterium]|nr:hypothetical protein [Candidatus Schekmanbacteria bacterium]
MGRMSSDMQRLHNEIMNGHNDRIQRMKNLKKDVAGMLHEFHTANIETGLKMQRMLKKNRDERRAYVKGMRKQIIAELSGAHQAWFGSAN